MNWDFVLSRAEITDTVQASEPVMNSERFAAFYDGHKSLRQSPGGLAHLRARLGQGAIVHRREEGQGNKRGSCRDAQ